MTDDSNVRRFEPEHARYFRELATGLRESTREHWEHCARLLNDELGRVAGELHVERDRAHQAAKRRDGGPFDERGR